MQRYEVHRGTRTSYHHRGDCNEVTGDQPEATSRIGRRYVPLRQAESWKHCLTIYSVSWYHSVWALTDNIFNIPPEGRAGQLVGLIDS